MDILLDYHTCAYCNRHLNILDDEGVMVILTTTCPDCGRKSSDRSGSYYICNNCDAIEELGEGDLIMLGLLKDGETKEDKLQTLHENIEKLIKDKYGDE